MHQNPYAAPLQIILFVQVLDEEVASSSFWVLLHKVFLHYVLQH